MFEKNLFHGEIYDPACGTGNILASAQAAGHSTIGSDIVDRGSDLQDFVHDFLMKEDEKASVDNIVSNPPFGLCNDGADYAFVRKALAVSTGKVAFLLPSNWIQGKKRSTWLETTPLQWVFFLCPRPSMPPGQVLAAGVKPGNGTTDYAWYIFSHSPYKEPPKIGWLYK